MSYVGGGGLFVFALLQFYDFCSSRYIHIEPCTHPANAQTTEHSQKLPFHNKLICGHLNSPHVVCDKMEGSKLKSDVVVLTVVMAKL